MCQWLFGVAFMVVYVASAMKETELAQHFINYFGEHADVYCEVPLGGGTCDFVIKNTPTIVAVEVKKQFSLDVVEQAIDRIGYAHYIYVAVPMAKRRRLLERICRDYGIGVLLYEENSKNVWEDIKPRLYRNIVKPSLESWMKANTAGSQSNRLTAFGYFVNEIYGFLSRQNGLTYEELFKLFERPYYKKLTYFKKNIYAYCRNGTIKMIKIEKGRLYLDMEQYPAYKEEMINKYGRSYMYS